MDHINTDNLFNSNSSGPININDLFNLDKSNNTESVVKHLIDNKKQQKVNAYLEYKKSFDMCLLTIKRASNMNKTDIFFKVPQLIVGCSFYNSLDCLYYIQNKLRNMNIDTLIINKFTIFISWINIDK